MRDRQRDSNVPGALDAGPSNGAPGHCLVWRFPTPLQSLSSSLIGGGLGSAAWALNMTVDSDYSRLDPEDHLSEVALRLGLTGPGVAMMTAVDVRLNEFVCIEGVDACVTVGAHRPVWAAAVGAPESGPGTINTIVRLPVRLGDAALVNVVATVTEAKSQALFERSIAGTGTASDAVCVLCETSGPVEPFGGPRSAWGARSAQAVYAAVLAGIDRQRAS